MLFLTLPRQFLGASTLINPGFGSEGDCTSLFLYSSPGCYRVNPCLESDGCRGM